MSTPKVKALSLRLDIGTYRALHQAMDERGIGWQALGEALVREFLAEAPRIERTPVDETFARILPREKRYTLAFGGSR